MCVCVCVCVCVYVYIHHEKCRLDEAQTGIKIAGRNISNLRYADDTTLMAESEEELKSLFAFCHKGHVICISEVIDISPGNLDSLVLPPAQRFS